MTVDELEAMPVAEWALPDCVLLLWVPGPHTLQGLELMAAWGFSFKGTAFDPLQTSRDQRYSVQEAIRKMTVGASLYEPINVFKPMGPDIGIVDGPFEYLTVGGVTLPLP